VKEILFYALTGNAWGWFHCLAGGVIYVAARTIEIRIRGAFALTLAIAVAWEVGEALTIYPIEVYGSTTRWAWDSIGDVVLAMACALIVASNERA
jgi:hypothetical protein